MFSVIWRGGDEPTNPWPVIVKQSNRQPTEWFDLGGGCLTADCTSALNFVGRSADGAAIAIWATRRAVPIGGFDAWEVTDVYIPQGGVVVGAAQDCGAGTFPLANADGTVVVLTLDAAGTIVVAPIESASCVEITG
jgi:hypothetical protein